MKRKTVSAMYLNQNKEVEISIRCSTREHIGLYRISTHSPSWKRLEKFIKMGDNISLRSRFTGWEYPNPGTFVIGD